MSLANDPFSQSCALESPCDIPILTFVDPVRHEIYYANEGHTSEHKRDPSHYSLLHFNDSREGARKGSSHPYLKEIPAKLFLCLFKINLTMLASMSQHKDMLVMHLCLFLFDPSNYIIETFVFWFY